MERAKKARRCRFARSRSGAPARDRQQAYQSGAARILSRDIAAKSIWKETLSLFIYMSKSASVIDASQP